MTDCEKVKLIRKILEDCLEFDYDKGTAMADALCVIELGEEHADA